MLLLNTTVAATKPKKVRTKWKGSDIAGWLFCLPMILGMLVFTFYPMIRSFLYSFQNTNGIVMKNWVGTANYSYIFNDKLFWQAIGNTLFMGALSVIGTLVFAFLVASLINNLRIGKGLFKSLYFLPNVISTIAAAILFNFLFYPTKDGLVNYLLSFLGIAPLRWFSSPQLAPITMVIMGTWFSVGYDSLLFLAGLQGISPELYEAAEVDGASGLQRWWYITIPSCRNTFVFILIMKCISSMNRFADVYMIGGTAGNPSGSLLTIVLYIYRTGFSNNQVGMASAAAYCLFLLTFTITAINQYITGRWSD